MRQATVSIVNLAADGTTVNSQFDYLMTVWPGGFMTTAGQTTTYNYDAIDNSPPSICRRATILYQYDAAVTGSKSATAPLGTTNYTTKQPQRIHAGGGTTYQYDATGNLVAETTSVSPRLHLQQF